MAFTKRKVVRGTGTGYVELIEGYIQGRYSNETELGEAARDPWFPDMMADENHQIGQLARRSWHELGPAALKRCNGDLPRHLIDLIRWCGWPPGDFPEQRAALERYKAEQIAFLARWARRALGKEH